MNQLLQDLRYGARMLAKNPGFTAVAVLTLALGIGANSAIFTLLDAVMLKMLPVRQPEQLYFLTQLNRPKGDLFHYSFFAELRAGTPAVSGILAFGGPLDWNVRADGHATVATGQVISGSYYPVLGVAPVLGRLISEQDDIAPGAHPVAVVSYGYWKRKFALSRSVLGKTLVINGSSFTIIGVTPPEFFGLFPGHDPDVSVPLAMLSQALPGESLTAHNRMGLRIAVRLKANTSARQAEAALTGMFGRLLADTERQQSHQARLGLESASKGGSRLRQQFSRPLVILMTLVAAVLLIACANVAGLLLARAARRNKEVALRVALGASRVRIVRQLLTESAIIAALAGGSGLLLNRWALTLLANFIGSGPAIGSLQLGADWRILTFTGVVSALTAFLVGLAPALRAFSASPWLALKDLDGSSADASRRSGRLPGTLVAGQVVVTFVLLLFCALFVDSLRNLKNLHPGFEKDNILLFTVDPTLRGYTGPAVGSLYRQLLDGLERIPGVKSASFSRMRLLSGSSTTGTIPAAGQPARGDQEPFVHINHVGPQFFETMGMTLLMGRGFVASDNDQAPRVAVVNETAARRYFGAQSPIGKRLGTTGQTEIVGLVRDAKYDSLRADVPPTVFLPLLQLPDQKRPMHFAVRTAGDPASLIAQIQNSIHGVDPELLVSGFKTQAAQVDDLLIQERLLATLSSFFGMLALLMACIGLNGLTAYRVARRTREIGIRIALGAQRHAVLRMVVWEPMRLVVAGIAIGLPLALAATRLVTSLLFGLTAADPARIGAVALLLAVVAGFAAYVPARRATKVDPMVALRYE